MNEELNVKMIKIILAIMFVAILSSCATTSKIDLTIKTNSVVNLSQTNGKSPIAVSVYQLSNDTAFKQANYDQLLWGDVDGVITKKTWVIWPNQQSSQQIILAPNAKAIGIVAAYRNIHGKNWKTVQTWGWWSHSIDIKITQQGIED